MSAAASASLLSKSLRLSSTLKMEEETINMKKQGIGSILGSDSDRSKSSSLRRTLSADMSSTKWAMQHGFAPMKKIASSEEFSVSAVTDSEGEDEEEGEEGEAQSQFDIWSSIQQDKCSKELASSSPPYIHPLVKRSTSSLTEKSLQVCTESLGSETGSDGFSSCPPSETSTDGEDDKEVEQVQQQQPQEGFEVEDIHIPKYNYVVGKKSSSQRSFPPPIPSLSSDHGASIRMQSRRDNGRLVLEAVSVPTTNNFRAQRQDGRLVLTFIDTHSTEQQLPKNYKEDVFDNFDEEDDEVAEETDEEEEDKEMEYVMEQAPKLSRVISLHRLTLMLNTKHWGVAKKNPTWPNKFNEAEKIDQPTMVAQSLPPPPRMARLIPKPPVKAAATTAATAAAGASLNAYEYYWRPKPAMSPQSKKDDNHGGKLMIINSKNPMENYEQQRESLVSRGTNKGDDYLVPLLKSCCKEPRRSLPFREPHCIATS